MHIAICEDVQGDANAIIALLEEYRQAHPGMALTYTHFQNAEALLAVVDHGFDCYLLDIFMSRQNGIELARRLRRQGVRSQIIFLTSSPDYALQAFSVRAANYLLKPVGKSALFASLDEMAEAIEGYRAKPPRQYSFRTPGGLYTMMLNDILYVEIIAHTPFYHLTSGVIRGSDLRVAFEKNMEPLMDSGQFLCPHRSYRVNAAHVTVVNTQSLCLDNGVTIPVARMRAAEVKARYLDYLMEVGSGD